MAGEDDDDDESFDYSRSWKVAKLATAFLPAIAACCAFLFMLAVFRVRNPFNLYVLALVFPDFLLNAVEAIDLFWVATHDLTHQSALCRLRDAVTWNYYFTNLWLNAVVGHQVSRMVRLSRQLRRTQPPRTTLVMQQITAVYLTTGFVSLWWALEVRWSPVHLASTDKCLVESGSPTEDPVFSSAGTAAIGALMVFPPLVYVFYLAYDIWKQKLLPIRGHTKALAIFFFRIVWIFTAFYVPGITMGWILIDMTNEVAIFWLEWSFSLLIPAQTLVTMRLLMTKDDIRAALAQQFSALSLAAEDTTRGEDDWRADDIYDEPTPPDDPAAASSDVQECGQPASLESEGVATKCTDSS